MDNFTAALDFVWRPEFDSLSQGYHCERGDPGKGTLGGVIQATWENAVRNGIAKGKLIEAGPAQLSTVLKVKFWGPVCDQLPDGLDRLVFNGRMMTGRYPWLCQQCLGFMGPDGVDGVLGSETMAAVKLYDPKTLIYALSGVHCAYLSTLETWAQFGHGWTTRLQAALNAALALVHEKGIVA